ncbi:MAG: hypothetical protein AAGA48_01780 [Myxococcota bacterium]
MIFHLGAAALAQPVLGVTHRIQYFPAALRQSAFHATIAADPFANELVVVVEYQGDWTVEESQLRALQNQAGWGTGVGWTFRELSSRLQTRAGGVERVAHYPSVAVWPGSRDVLVTGKWRDAFLVGPQPAQLWVQNWARADFVKAPATLHFVLPPGRDVTDDAEHGRSNLTVDYPWFAKGADRARLVLTYVSRVGDDDAFLKQKTADQPWWIRSPEHEVRATAHEDDHLVNAFSREGWALTALHSDGIRVRLSRADSSRQGGLVVRNDVLLPTAGVVDAAFPLDFPTIASAPRQDRDIIVVAAEPARPRGIVWWACETDGATDPCGVASAWGVRTFERFRLSGARRSMAQPAVLGIPGRGDVYLFYETDEGAIAVAARCWGSDDFAWQGVIERPEAYGSAKFSRLPGSPVPVVAWTLDEATVVLHLVFVSEHDDGSVDVFHGYDRGYCPL